MPSPPLVPHWTAHDRDSKIWHPACAVTQFDGHHFLSLFIAVCHVRCALKFLDRASLGDGAAFDHERFVFNPLSSSVVLEQHFR